MGRFQALTNNVLDAELEMLRERLGLKPSQKAELLREVAALAAWVVRQAEQGREIEARQGQRVEPLVHPALQRLRSKEPRAIGERLILTDDQARRLAAALDRGFDPTPALRSALANLSKSERRPPKLRWKKSAA
jgi:hypothetical protein